MSQSNYLPITSILVFSDQSKCQSPFKLLALTNDGSNHSANLWPTGVFDREERYLAFSTQKFNNIGKPADFACEVRLVGERDPIPPNFTLIEQTSDSRKQALKKQKLCVRWAAFDKSLSEEPLAVVELLIGKAHNQQMPNFADRANIKRLGETNGLQLWMRVVPRSFLEPTPIPAPVLPQSSGPLPGVGPGPSFSQQQPMPVGPSAFSQPVLANAYHAGPPETTTQRQQSRKDPLADVRFKIQESSNIRSIQDTLTKLHSLPDINPEQLRQFIEGYTTYNFETERTVLQAAASASHSPTNGYL